MSETRKVDIIDGNGMFYSALVDDGAIQIGTGPQCQIRLGGSNDLEPLHLLVRTLENGTVALFNVSSQDVLHFPDSVRDVFTIKPNGQALLAHQDRIHFGKCTLVYHGTQGTGRLRLDLTFDGEAILHPTKPLTGQVQIEYLNDREKGPQAQDAVQFQLELVEPQVLIKEYFDAPVGSTIVFPNTEYRDIKKFAIRHTRDSRLRQGHHRFRFRISAIDQPALNAVIGRDIIVAPYYRHTLTTQPYQP